MLVFAISHAVALLCTLCTVLPLYTVSLKLLSTDREYYEWTPDTKSFIARSRPLDKESRWGQNWSVPLSTMEPVFKFRSQGGQDHITLDMLDDKKGGYFVDLAAHDWRSGSNTYIMELYNSWSGICIEANPADLDGLLGNRKCDLYVNPVGLTTGQKLQFHFHKKGLNPGAYSGLVGSDFDNKSNVTSDGVRADVWTVSLEDILEHSRAPTTVDYLSLDIEGAEYFALKHFPFDKRKFLVMTIERPTRPLHVLLVKNGIETSSPNHLSAPHPYVGYVFVKEISGGDYGECLYLHNSVPKLHALMEKHHLDNVIPRWLGKNHHYLVSPRWAGDEKGYLESAKEISHAGHHNADKNAVRYV